MCCYTPQQIGLAKRNNRHIAEAARALMNEKEMPKYYWAGAIHAAVYIMNRTPTAVIHGMTLEKKLQGRSLTCHTLRCWLSCLCTHTK